MKEQRNGDGDTLEVIQAVWGEFGVGSILFHGTVLHPTDGEPHWDALLKWYKIRAKHADRFDKDCMSFETWARRRLAGEMYSRKAMGRHPPTHIWATTDS